jgi:probable phosphoglycerate mutase
MGREDLPLDDVGQRQVEALTSAMQSAIPAQAALTVHSSPLRRAIQTIAPFAAARDVPLHVDQRLVEMDFGPALGTEPRRKLRLKKHHLYHPLPGGESLFQVWQRAVAFFAHVRPELDSGRTVVVVAHYRVSQLLAGVASGRDFEEDIRTNGFKPANASLFEMRCSAHDRPLTGPRPLWSPPVASRPEREQLG